MESNDKNERIDVAADVNYDVNDDLDIMFRVYNSYYTKRNTTTMQQYADFGYPNQSKSGAIGMSANVDVLSYELSSNWQATDNHLLTAGVESRDEKREATVFSQGPDMDTRKVSYQAFYLQDDFSVTDTLAFTIGGRYDQYNQAGYTDSFGLKHDSKTDSESTFRIGALKNFNSMFNLRANIAQGYRVPDIRELFIQKQTPAGMQLGAQSVDPRFGKQSYDLKAERTMSYEIGLSGRDKGFSYNAVVFHNDIKDKIEQITAQAQGKPAYFTFENVSDAMTQGSELTLGYDVSDALTTKFFWTELRTENKETKKDLEFNPERVISLTLDWNITERFRTGFDATYTGEQKYTNNNADQTTDAYMLTNLTLGYKFGEAKQIDAFGGVNNLFDEKVDKRLGSNVGSYYYAGVRVNF